MLYREWCLYPNTRRGCMLPLNVLAKFEKAADAGYASVYMFDETAALEIRASGSSSGLARFPVYTDTLTLDLDKGEAQLKRVREAIVGLEYKVYESGGKGFHVVIALDRMVSGTNVPYSQRQWVEALNVEADLSLYQAGHIISLPGRKHPKTGKRKRLTDSVEGRKLSLPLLDRPQPQFSFQDTHQGNLERGLWRLLGLLQSEPGVGNRHTALWGTAKELADAGLEFDTVLNLLTEVNAKWDEPKAAEEVKAAVTQAYKQRNISG